MIIKEKRINLSKLIYNSSHKYNNHNSFIILDDKTITIDDNINIILKKINEYNYNCDLVDINKMAEVIVDRIININNLFDTVITVGTGGMQTFNSIKNNKVFDNKFIYNIKWSRYWKGDSFLGFETNIDNYYIKNKRIIIIEDVIASGNTIWTLKEYLDNNNNEVVMICSALIQESSPIVNKSFCETYSSMMIEKTENDELDPFWYPPIYSLRHLLFGDKEMNNFYNVFNEKYFNGNNDVEVLIKKIRR